jgi:hypothetical protein
MFSTKVIAMFGLLVWSGVGGGWVVNHIHSTRGVVVVERVRYEPNPFAAQVEKYVPLMEQLLGDRDRRAMASAPRVIRQSPDDRRVVGVPPLPRARPDRGHTPGSGHNPGSVRTPSPTLEDVITLAEAGL